MRGVCAPSHTSSLLDVTCFALMLQAIILCVCQEKVGVGGVGHSEFLNDRA